MLIIKSGFKANSIAMKRCEFGNAQSKSATVDLRICAESSAPEAACIGHAIKH